MLTYCRFLPVFNSHMDEFLARLAANEGQTLKLGTLPAPVRVFSLDIISDKVLYRLGNAESHYGYSIHLILPFFF